jgi:hypothetical protein
MKGLVAVEARISAGGTPTFVARMTLDLTSGFLANHLPMISSEAPGIQRGSEAGAGYISATSMKLPPRSST